MNSTCSRSPGTVSGVLAEKSGSVIFFGTHSSFTILEPSGNALPLPGTPSRYAWIITGLATIARITFAASVKLGPTTCHCSYPLTSENASPPGICSVYLSCFTCAEMDLPPTTARIAATVYIVFFMAFSSADLFGSLGFAHRIGEKFRPLQPLWSSYLVRDYEQPEYRGIAQQGFYQMPDTRPDKVRGKSSVPGMERCTRSDPPRHTSQVEAVRGKAARTVLCGGRPAMVVPTAIP